MNIEEELEKTEEELNSEKIRFLKMKQKILRESQQSCDYRIEQLVKVSAPFRGRSIAERHNRGD